MEKLYKIIGKVYETCEIKVIECDITKMTNKGCKVTIGLNGDSREVAVKESEIAVVKTNIDESSYNFIFYYVWATEDCLEECKTAIKEKLRSEIEKREKAVKLLRESFENCSVITVK